MKSVTMFKVLGVCALSSLPLLGGPAHADSCLAPGLSAPMTPLLGASPLEAGPPWMKPMDARLGQEMARIEAALRAGRITPYQAGALARAQWDAALFQRGFQDKGREAGRGGSCGLSPDLVATLAPLVGNMAKGGIQTASTIMSAVAQEVARLIQEEERAKAARGLESL